MSDDSGARPVNWVTWQAGVPNGPPFVLYVLEWMVQRLLCELAAMPMAPGRLRCMRGIAVAAAAILLIAGLWKIPEIQVAAAGISEGEDAARLADQLRRTWATILGGLGGLVLLYLTWRRIAATERTAEAAFASTRLAEKGQITDRFESAVKQLADDREEIRFGGVYALSRLANEADDDDLHVQAVNVLASFLRNAEPVIDGNELYMEPTARAALLEIAKRKRREVPAPWPDLSRGVLAGELSSIELNNAKLVAVDARGISLGRADLSGADLYKANLSQAKLSWASLRGAHLSGADLSGAELSAANLGGADLSGANLYKAVLAGADSSGADLSGADLSEAFLRGANFYKAGLAGADLSGANLREANFYKAVLAGADLSGADLRGARDLTCTELTAAKHWESAYRDADLACGAKIPDPPPEK